MIEERKISGVSFHVDQLGIDQLKNDFLSEAREFVYFRKGEWTGAANSVQHLVQLMQANPAWVPTMTAFYEPAKEVIADVALSALAKAAGATIEKVWEIVQRIFLPPRPPDKDHYYVTVRVICTRRRGIGAEIAEWEERCGKGSVVVIPESRVGQLRYIVNEKRYAVFCRLDSNSLQGIMGTDQQTIRMLRNMFDREFIVASIRSSKS